MESLPFQEKIIKCFVDTTIHLDKRKSKHAFEALNNC